MAISSQKKKQVVEQAAEASNRATLVIAVEYHGLTSNEMNDLRSKARQDNVSVHIVKNTLAKRALQDTPYACLTDGLSGPMALIFSNDEASAAARLVKDFGKEHENLKVKLVALAGELREVSEVNRLASLPSREQAIALLLAVMKEPIAKLARVLIAPHSQLVRVIDAVRVKKQETQ